MPMERRGEGSISCGSTDRTGNDVLDHLKMKDCRERIRVKWLHQEMLKYIFRDKLLVDENLN